MFAYRYDNLTISKSLYKQMIGEIAIMRNPWPIFSIAALSGAACLIYDHFFSYETMWIAVVALLALLALCFFAYCKYERWLAKKLNPYVVAYQSDHNLENLKQGLDLWRPWAFSKHSPILLQRTGSPLCWSKSAGQKRKKLWNIFGVEPKIRRIKWGITCFGVITQGQSETPN